MAPIIGDSPETDVQILVPIILKGGENLEPLAEAFSEAQAQCCEEGIAGIFVPYGEGKLAVVVTDPDKATILSVR
jgi:hypothetical protein